MSRQRLWFVGLAALLIALSLFAYRDGFRAELINWDDHRYLTENPKIQGLTPDNLVWMLTSVDLDNWHPLTWLAHGVLYHFVALEPWWHHAFNIVMHIANAIWLLALCLILIPLVRGAEAWRRPTAFTWLAGFSAALLFALHPQHVESVVWVSERKDVLCLFFMLPAFMAYIAYTQSQRRAARRYWYGLSVLCFALAILAKPMAVSFPLLLLLLDAYPLQRVWPVAPWRWSVVWEKTPFVLLSLLSVVLTFIAQHSWLPNIEIFSFEHRLLNATRSVFFYLSKTLLPLNLSPLYPYPVDTALLKTPQVYLGILGFVLVSVSCAYLWLQRRYVWLVIWLFYLVTLLPVIGIVQVGAQAAADRYVYLPTLPFYLLFGVGFARLATHRQRAVQVAAWSSLVVIVLIFSSLTRQQTWVWQDDISFRLSILSHHPDDANFQANAGDAYVRRGDYSSAIGHYRTAIKLNPLKFEFYSVLIGAYQHLGDQAGALEALEYALAHEKPLLQAEAMDRDQHLALYLSAGELYCLQGRFAMASDMVSKALALNANDTGAQRLQHDVQAGSCQ